MSLGPGQIDPRDTFVEYYKGINIYGHADTPTYYFFWGGVLFDGFPSQLAAVLRIDDLSRTGLGDASPVDVVPPGPVDPLVDTYRGVPIYQREWGFMGGGTGYATYFYYKGEQYSWSAPYSTVRSQVHAKIDELLATQPYIPPTQPPYTPPTGELPPSAAVTVSVPSGWSWWGGVLEWFGNLWREIIKSDQDAREKVAIRSIAETRSISLDQAAEIRETTKEAYKPAGLGGWLWGGLTESMKEIMQNAMHEALAEISVKLPEATSHSPEWKKQLDAVLEPYANSVVASILQEVDPKKFTHSGLSPEDASRALLEMQGGIIVIEIALFLAHAAAEAASLGQYEAIHDFEELVLSKLGLNVIAGNAVTIPLNELVFKRAQQYYASQYQPEIPSYQDLIEMVVKEVIPLDEFKHQMKYLGYSERWSQYIWDKHFIPPSLNDILTAWRRGLIDEKRVDELMILVDLDPRFKQIFDTRKYVTPPLSLTRFMFETGAIGAETVRKNVALEGFAPEYVDAVTSYIVNFQARRWRTRYLQALATGLTKGVVTEAEVLSATLEAGYTADVAKWIVETSKVRAKITGAVGEGVPTKLIGVGDLKKAYVKNMIDADKLRIDLGVRGYQTTDIDLLVKILDEEKVVTSAGGEKVALSVPELKAAWKYKEVTEDRVRIELQMRGLSLEETDILINTWKKQLAVEE